MTIEPLRRSLPFLVGAVVPLFFLSVYLGSCFSRLRQRRARCRAEFGKIEAALRERLRAAREAAGPARARPAASPRLERCLAAADTLDQLLSSPRFRWPDQLDRVQQAAASLAAEMAVLEFPAGSPPPQTSWPGAAAPARPWAEAVAAYNREVEEYARVRRRFPTNLLAACLGLGSLPAWPERP